MNSKVKTVVLPIAGLGTRFLPATKSISKEMLPVVDRPLIQYAVEEAKQAGISKFIFIVSSNEKQVRDHFTRNPLLENRLQDKQQYAELKAVQEATLDPDSMIFVKQSERLGLGHAVWCARKHIQEEYFAVLLPDDLIVADVSAMRQTVGVFNTVGNSVLAVEQVSKEKVGFYGIIEPGIEGDQVTQLTDVIEKPAIHNAPSNFAVVGRYVLSKEIFCLLEKKRQGVGGEIQLTDAIRGLFQTEAVHAFTFKGKRFDCGRKAGFVAANVARARRDNDLIQRVEELLT